MQGTLTTAGTGVPATADGVVRALADPAFFWLDLDVSDPSETDWPQLFRTTFHFHPLAVEDAENFGQRPKIDDYDDACVIIAHGAPAGADTEEIHLFLGTHFLVTVHHGSSEVIDTAWKGVERHHSASDGAAPQIVLAYLILDALTDTFFPMLSAFDDRVDTLQAAILAGPTDEQLGEIFAMKRELMTVRKVVTPQRDMFAGLTSGVIGLPGMTEESARYFRDLYDHLIRINDMVDGYRDLLSGVMDIHISTVSNRLNVVMKQLAIIATVFLPLSFLTGFFGQNFAWLTTRITSGWTFALFGIGTEILAVAILGVTFWRRGWFGGPTA